MVAPEKKEISGVLYFVSQKQANDLERVFAPIDIISQKQIIRFGRILAVIKQSKQIRILAMNIPCVTQFLPQTLRGASN